MTRREAVDVWIYNGGPERMRRASIRHAGCLMVSVTHALAARDGVVVRLPSTPRYIMLALAAARGGLMSEAELMELVFRDREDGGPETLRIYVAMARTAAAALGLLLDVHWSRGFHLRPIVCQEAA